jgi:hypothetical protein
MSELTGVSINPTFLCFKYTLVIPLGSWVVAISHTLPKNIRECWSVAADVRREKERERGREREE